MRAERGFTLIEILVVLVIISISFSFAVLAFGDFGAQHRILLAAEQLASHLKLLQYQAMIEGKSWGIYVNNKGYQTYHFTPQQNWQTIATNRIFQWQAFPNQLKISLQTAIKNKLNEPNIIINASGQLTAFKLHFGTEKQAELTTLIGDQNGQINFLKPLQGRVT